MAALRRREQTEAADRVGVHDLRFLGYPDGRVEATLGLRKDLARVIRQVRPDRVVCPSPERDYVRPGISHPDHRAVGSAALDAVYPDARNPFAFPELLADEGLEEWTVREVWINGPGMADALRGRDQDLPAQGRGAARAREPDRPPAMTSRSCCGSAWPPPEHRPGCPMATWPRRSASWTPADPPDRAGLGPFCPRNWLATPRTAQAWAIVGVVALVRAL